MADICSVPSPLLTACKSTLEYYKHSCFDDMSKELLGVCHARLVSANPYIVTLITVLFVSGGRIGELLSCTTSDIIPKDTVLIHGEKKSRDYLLYLPGLEQCFSRSLSQGVRVPIFPFTYNQVYRTAKKLSLGRIFEGHTNMTVTHLGRYIKAQQVSSISSVSSASDILKHRSSKTIQYYLRKEI
jgi:hypothetical protein